MKDNYNGKPISYGIIYLETETLMQIDYHRGIGFYNWKRELVEENLASVVAFWKPKKR